MLIGDLTSLSLTVLFLCLINCVMGIISTRLLEQIGILYTNCWTEPVFTRSRLLVVNPISEVLSIAKASCYHILHDAITILVHHFDDATT